MGGEREEVRVKTQLRNRGQLQVTHMNKHNFGGKMQ